MHLRVKIFIWTILLILTQHTPTLLSLSPSTFLLSLFRQRKIQAEIIHPPRQHFLEILSSQQKTERGRKLCITCIFSVLLQTCLLYIPKLRRKLISPTQTTTKIILIKLRKVSLHSQRIQLNASSKIFIMSRMSVMSTDD